MRARRGHASAKCDEATEELRVLRPGVWNPSGIFQKLGYRAVSRNSKPYSFHFFCVYFLSLPRAPVDLKIYHLSFCFVFFRLQGLPLAFSRNQLLSFELEMRGWIRLGRNRQYLCFIWKSIFGLLLFIRPDTRLALLLFFFCHSEGEIEKFEFLTGGSCTGAALPSYLSPFFPFAVLPDHFQFRNWSPGWRDARFLDIPLKARLFAGYSLARLCVQQQPDCLIDVL